MLGQDGENDVIVTPYSIRNLTEADIIIERQVNKDEYEKYQRKINNKKSTKPLQFSNPYKNSNSSSN